MSRDINDPRVALVARAIDRAIASPFGVSAGLIGCVAGALLDYPWNCADPRFEYDGSEWTGEQMRAVTVAYALHCPENELDELAAEAEEKIAWVEWWEAPGGGDHQAKCLGCSECRTEVAA